MNIISIAKNKYNSRATIKFTENGTLSNAVKIAKKHSCSFSHNVTTKPIVNAKGEITFNESFGTISFNKGSHENALDEFLNTHK